ncbi:MAG TPA: isoleucine--tRNA ligase [Candidatus Saccharimonadales bacterium]|nr:isoleucine--tRNA ligase [Candidatus Saccharimonadales bacterium]
MSQSPKSLFADIEESVLDAWRKEHTFEKSVTGRQGAERFNFNDGPPFANGLPHFGHSLVTGIKDSILRYKTMRGYYVPRRNGWDCHGLPVEYDIEKQFNVSGKKQILELGLEKFNAACRASIFKYKADWEEFLTRYGRWSDYADYYATVDTTYTESVWWILSEINKKGLLYKGLKSVPYCPRCQTPLSNFELNEGYKDNVPDPSVFAYFPLKDDPNTKLLAWTTTPWTLPANSALAVKQDADYAYVELKSDGSTVILAKDRLDQLDLRGNEYKLLKTVKGRDLIGKRYEPLYPIVDKSKFTPEQLQNVHQVFHDDSVSLEDGTGVLHVAPRYGEADLALGLAQDLPLLESVDSSGSIVETVKKIDGLEAVGGLFFKDADEHIIADLTRKGKIFAAETQEHTYPFCWRCDTPLMYFATDTWFIAINKVKDQLLATAQDINWVPANIKNGRFGQWLEGARDWAISRNRYWGAPMPVWVNTEDETDYMVISSIDELKQLAGEEAVAGALPKLDDGWPDLHRPFIDQITFQKDGKTYKRVEEVLDCWFESGSMPIAQWHYPFENKDKAEELLTADFITEGLDQTRLWFYVQHVISTILFNKPAYKNVIVTGIIMAADGQKLSKRLRNYPPTQDVFDKEGADAWRLYLLGSAQATETADYTRFNRDAVIDLQRNALGTLYNSFKFFKTYADLDKWTPAGLSRPDSDNPLDKWILARLDETVASATKSADAFKIAHAIEPVLGLIDDLSNWYIRRSRKRFWKSENDGDKQQAYATLYYCLMSVCQLLAPWSPFLPDHIWRNLRAGEMPESVHLSDWPSVNKPDNTSHTILDEMAKVRQYIVEGLAQRAAAKIKVRQPLSRVEVPAVSEPFKPIIAEELNVKEVIEGSSVKLNTELTPELEAEGLARDLVRSVQNARKNAGFNVEDRIQLRLETESEQIGRAIEAHRKDMIYPETLTTGELTAEGDHSETAKINGQAVTITLKKA